MEYNELNETELSSIYGGAPFVNATTIESGIPLDKLEQIKAGLHNQALAYGEAAKADVYSDKRAELEKARDELLFIKEMNVEDIRPRMGR